MRGSSTTIGSNRCIALGLLAALGASAVAGDVASTEPAAAHDAAPAPVACHATIVPLGQNVKQCPLASLRFHVSVPDCRNSQGSFVYQYLLVSQEAKETVQHTARWIAYGTESELTERVSAACDQEVDGAEVQQVNECTCAKQ